MALRLASSGSARESGPDAFLAAIDGREVVVGGQSWVLEAYGLLEDARHRWLQVGLKGQPSFILTLELAAGAGVRAALLAVAAWLASPKGISFLQSA